MTPIWVPTTAAITTSRPVDLAPARQEARVDRDQVRGPRRKEALEDAAQEDDAVDGGRRDAGIEDERRQAVQAHGVARSRSIANESVRTRGQGHRPGGGTRAQPPGVRPEPREVHEALEPRAGLERAHRRARAGRCRRGAAGRVVPGPAVPAVTVPTTAESQYGLADDPPSQDRRRRADRREAVQPVGSRAQDALDLERREGRVLEARVVEEPEARVVVVERARRPRSSRLTRNGAT